MNNNVLTVQLKPNYNSTAESLGFDIETDDINSDAVLFQQGYNMDEIEIELGEKFKISTEFENGTIFCDEVKYKLIKRKMFGENETLEGQDIIILEPGSYIYHLDGLTIEELKDIDEDLDEDDL